MPETPTAAFSFDLIRSRMKFVDYGAVSSLMLMRHLNKDLFFLMTWEGNQMIGDSKIKFVWSTIL